VDKKSAVLFLNFNRVEYTKTVLWNYLQNTTNPHVLEIVDNGSMDGTAEFLKYLQESSFLEREYPYIEVHYTFYDKNELYARPVNEFWQKYMDREDIQYYGRVLNDIIVEKEWLKEYEDIMDAIPKTGLIMTADGKPFFDNVVKMDPARVLTENGKTILICNKQGHGFNGHSQLMRKSAIKDVGFMDTRGIMAPVFWYGSLQQAGWIVCNHPSFENKMLDINPILGLEGTNKYKTYAKYMNAHKMGKLFNPSPNMYDGVPICGGKLPEDNELKDASPGVMR